MKLPGLNIILIATGLAFVAFQACKPSDSDVPAPPTKVIYGNGTPGANYGGTANPFGFPGSGTSSSFVGPISPIQFQGTWRSSCFNDPARHVSWLMQWIIANDQFTETLQQYSDGVCATSQLTQTRRGSFILNAQNSAGTAAGTNLTVSVDYEIASEFTMLQSQEYAQSQNNARFCNADNWAINISYNTIKCQESRTHYDFWGLQTSGTQFFLQGLIDGSHSGLTPDARPTTLDTAARMRKVQ